MNTKRLETMLNTLKLKNVEPSDDFSTCKVTFKSGLYVRVSLEQINMYVRDDIERAKEKLGIFMEFKKDK